MSDTIEEISVTGTRGEAPASTGVSLNLILIILIFRTKMTLGQVQRR